MSNAAGKNADNGVVEFQFYKPDNRTKWESIQTAIYDKSTNRVLGRTLKSWGQLLFFYSVFYIVLAALFAICMQGLFATLDKREPKWKLDESLIGVNPGLGFRPISNNTEEGSLIWFNVTNTTSSQRWVNFIDQFLVPYRANQSGKNFVHCDFNNPPPADKVCITTPDHFGECGPKQRYGYGTFSPCIFLKLNRIIDWVPEYITTPKEDMPENLQNYITKIDKSSNESRIWVSCNGVSDVDKESIKDFDYYPKGFSNYYYPFKNVENYLSPIVAVKIHEVKPNVVIQVECRAWAGNIKYVGGSLNRAGSVTFEIQVDGAYNNPLIKAKSLNITEKSEKMDSTPTPMTEEETATTVVLGTTTA